MDIKLTKEQFDKLKVEPAFVELLCLARVANSLRFSLLSTFTFGLEKNSSTERQSINSFFISMGILHEGFMVANRLGKYFKDYESFNEGFVRLRKSVVYKRFKNILIEGLRNKISFHFDSDCISLALSDLELENYTLFSCDDDTWKSAYYNLADIAALNFITSKSIDGNKIEDNFTDVLHEISSLCTEFVDFADKLITEYVNNLNKRFNP